MTETATALTTATSTTATTLTASTALTALTVWRAPRTGDGAAELVPSTTGAGVRTASALDERARRRERLLHQLALERQRQRRRRSA